jgi:octaprenyl-diphosphate synthase
MLDYSGDEQTTGKNLGDDLSEGKPTLPLIYAMQQGDARQAAMIKLAIEQGNIEGFTEVLQVIKQTGALEYTRQQAQNESDAACAALSILPDTAYKQSLLQLADFAATRQF